MFVVNCRQVGCPEEDGKQPSLLRLTYCLLVNQYQIWERNAHGHGLITTWAATNRYQRGKQALTLSLPGTRENQSHPHPLAKQFYSELLKTVWLWVWFLWGFFWKKSKRKDEIRNNPNFREIPSILIEIGLRLQPALFWPDWRTWWKWGCSPFWSFPSWCPNGWSNSVNFA